MEAKTISDDSNLLMPERVEGGQAEFGERSRAKLSGTMDIQQSIVTSSPDAMTKFGLTQVPTQLSEHLEKTKTSEAESGRVTRSASQVLRNLNYTIPKIDPASELQSTSKEEDSMKEDEDRKPLVEIDYEGFKILQGIAHNTKKRVIRK